MKVKNIVLVIVILLSICVFGFIKNLEYKEYVKNYNEKIGYIIDFAKEKGLKDQDVIDMLNSNTNKSNMLKKLNYDLDGKSVVTKNDLVFKKYLFIELSILLTTLLILVSINIVKSRKKNKEIKKIINLLDEINHHNYDIDINSMKEGELSILKNEIYKTTIMLRSIADNSIKDKENLKKSLEDISHQLKTPLTSIMINIDNILDNPNMDLKQRNIFIKKIKKEIYNIKNLVSSILKLSQFDVNTIKFIKEDITLDKLINLSVEKVSSLADLKNIKINIKGDLSDTLCCDKMWEVEAISNILKNALEYSNLDSNIDIEYSSNKVYQKIVIRNYGSTIDIEDQKHLFERFYKGTNSSSDSVGIGLSLAKNIVNLDNGNIYVESKDGITEFIIKYFKDIK